MCDASRARIVVPLLLGLMMFVSVPAFAQIDFTGVYQGNTNSEDGPERAAGPSLVEFLGLPVNDYGRQWGLAYKSSRLSLPEHECQVHVVSYIHRGPFGARIWEERDPVTHQLIAIHEAIIPMGSIGPSGWMVDRIPLRTLPTRGWVSRPAFGKGTC